MRSTILITAMVALSVATAEAAMHGNFYGYFKAEVEATPKDCPIEIIKAGVQDSENKSLAGKLFAPTPNMDGGSHSFSVRYDVGLKTQVAGVVAIETEWTGTNAFGEVQGKRRSSWSWNKPLGVWSSKTETESAERLGGDVSKYRIRLTRVKLADGTVWVAPETPTPAADPPAPPPAQ